MAPELWGILGALCALGKLAAAVVAYYLCMWVLFAACMAWDRQKHAPAVTVPPARLSPELAAMHPEGYTVPAGLAAPARALAYAWLVVGALANFVGNLGLTFVFLELPREVGITLRVTRWIERMGHKHAPRRKAFALWVRVTWLDGLDRKGIHRA